MLTSPIYRLRLFSNGSATPTNDILLSGTLNNQSVIGIRMHPLLFIQEQQPQMLLLISRDDTVEGCIKYLPASCVDIFGRIGEDPGAAWTVMGFFQLLIKRLLKMRLLHQVLLQALLGFPTLSTEWTVCNRCGEQPGIAYRNVLPCLFPLQRSMHHQYNLFQFSRFSHQWPLTGSMVMKQTDSSYENGKCAITGVPLNATTHLFVAWGGSGDVLNAGEYIVYNNTGSSIEHYEPCWRSKHITTIFEYNCAPGSKFILPGVSSKRTDIL